MAAVAAGALVLSLLTFEDSPPADPAAPRDAVAIGLAVAGSAAAFYGASELLTHKFLDAQTFAPLIGGLALIALLIVNQYRAKRPLLTIRGILSSTIPMAGIVIALLAAAASVSATALPANLLVGRYSPVHIGLLFLPGLGGALLTAGLLGVVLNRRAMQYRPLAGMVFLAAGIAVFRIKLPPIQALTLTGSGLIGIGLGATVAPALFAAGFSVPAANLQRVFAIVELLRAAAAFMIAPVFGHVAVTVGANPVSGTGIALWIGLGLAVGGAVIAIVIYLLGGARPQTPRLDRFLSGQGPRGTHPHCWPPPATAPRQGRSPRSRHEHDRSHGSTPCHKAQITTHWRQPP